MTAFYPGAVYSESFLASAIAIGKQIGLNYSFLLVPDERSAFAHGLVTTLELAGLSIICSLIAGVAMTAMLISRRAWISGSARAFVELTRNTPTLVQLYCGFLVLNTLISEALRPYANPLTPFIWVVGVVSLHKAAFHAEALRAGIDAVPQMTLEAAASLGFSRKKQLLLVQLPLALRFALPALINNLVDLVKMTAIASAIAVGDVTYQAIMIWTQRDNVLELMILILCYFGLLTYAVNVIGGYLEKHLRMPGYGQ